MKNHSETPYLNYLSLLFVHYSDQIQICSQRVVEWMALDGSLSVGRWAFARHPPGRLAFPNNTKTPYFCVYIP